MCVLTHERYKTYQTGFLFCHLGHAPGVGFCGVGDAQGVKKTLFEHGHDRHMAYQIDGHDKQRRMLSKMFTLGSNW